MNIRSDRTGFALPAAIGALVIIGVLVTAGFYVSQQEVRIGTANENAVLAAYLSDVAVGEVLDDWNYADMQALPLFDDTTFVDTLDYGDWEVDVFRIGTKMFFLNTNATISQGGPLLSGARRQTGTIVRVLSLDIDAPAAITTRGHMSFSGAPPELSGIDRVPTSWGPYCSGTLQDQIGFLSDDSSSVMTSSGGKGGKGGGGGSEVCVSQVTGAPCSQENAPLVDQVMAPFEGANWTELTSMADIVITGNPGNAGPVITGGVCDTSVDTNWGDPINPSSACGGYFPMVFFNNPGGETRLTGNGRGQGIFLFEGDLHIGGNYELYGLVVVNGGINSAGTPAIQGAVIADSTYSMKGNPDAFYSSCAVERAIFENANLTRARPIGNRSFIDLSSIISN